MSADEPVVLTALAEGILTVTLNRPAAMNSLSTELSHELTRTWQRATEADVRAVVITGAGRGFCAGADLREKRSGDIARESLRVTYHPLVLGLVGLEKPVIAAINGAVAGAGLAIALGADVRVASETAAFVPAFGAIGLIPDSGVGYLASRVLGESAALAWLTSGRKFTAAEAHQRGLVDSVVADPLAEALTVARTLAEVPGRAYGLTKRIMWTEGRRRLTEYLDNEIEYQQLAVNDPNRKRAREQVAARLGAAKNERQNDD